MCDLLKRIYGFYKCWYFDSGWGGNKAEEHWHSKGIVSATCEATLFKYVVLHLSVTALYMYRDMLMHVLKLVSVLAEDAIKAALSDYKIKQESLDKERDSKASG